jgi:hypothetical protein
MPPAIKTFNLPSQYGLVAQPTALGNVRVPHGSGLDEFAKFDSPLPRWILTLNFTGIRELYGANDAGPLGILPDLPYLYQFFEEHVCAGRKIFGVQGICKGDADDVIRLYTFADDFMDLKKFSFQLWSGNLKFIQFGCGDYTAANLPGDTI